MKPIPCLIVLLLAVSMAAHADVAVNAPLSGEEVTSPVQLVLTRLKQEYRQSHCHFHGWHDPGTRERSGG
jgi:hypothetical protein